MYNKLSRNILLFNSFCAVVFTFTIVRYLSSLRDLLGLDVYSFRDVVDVLSGERTFSSPWGLGLVLVPSFLCVIMFLVGIAFSGQRTRSAYYFQTILIALGFLSQLTVIPAVLMLVYWTKQDITAQYQGTKTPNIA